MGEPIPVLRGENVAITVFVNNVPYRQSDTCKTFKIAEAAVMHRDQYLGRKRAKGDKQVDGYDVSIEMDYSNCALMDALLAQTAAREANQPVPSITILFQAQNRDGTSNAHFVTDCQSKFELNAGGRTEAVGFSFELQGEEFKKAV
jgi:hypothetical protein